LYDIILTGSATRVNC